MNRCTQLVEFGFIIGHDALGTVFVQIVGDFGQGKATRGEFFQREGEQRGVVGFEVDLSALSQHLAGLHRLLMVLT